MALLVEQIVDEHLLSIQATPKRKRTPAQNFEFGNLQHVRSHLRRVIRKMNPSLAFGETS